MKNIFRILTVILACFLSGCTSLNLFPKKTIVFDVPAQALKITVEYSTLQFPQTFMVGGKVTVQNYGTKNYRTIMMQFSFYDDAKNLIATDTFYLNGGLIAGGSAAIQPDHPLSRSGGSGTFVSCPPSMNSGNVSITAF